MDSEESGVCEICSRYIEVVEGRWVSDDDHDHVPAAEQRPLSIEESVEAATQWGQEHNATVTVYGGRWTKPQPGVHRTMSG